MFNEDKKEETRKLLTKNGNIIVEKINSQRHCLDFLLNFKKN